MVTCKQTNIIEEIYEKFDALDKTFESYILEQKDELEHLKSSILDEISVKFKVSIL